LVEFELEEIVSGLAGEIVGASAVAGGASALPFSSKFEVSTDSRAFQEGEAFFALEGENFDGHDFLAEVCVKNPAFVVVSKKEKLPADFAGVAILVENVVRAYQSLAAAWRKKVNPFVIAVTGSVGKTTQKDMLYCILSQHMKTYATQGNFNNQIGVPKTILSMGKDAAALVLEMGMEYAGEIRRSCEIATPDAAVITNIGISHREHFDSDDGIRLAKYEVAERFGEGNTLIINPSDDDGLLALAENGARERGYTLVKIGEDYSVSDIEYTRNGTLACKIEGGGERADFELPIFGAYAATSAALASAGAALLGVDLGAAASALKTLKVTPHRLQAIRSGEVLLIDDSYNASPDSMRSGLESLAAAPGMRRIAVLADMNELGDESERLHFEVGRLAAALGIDEVFTFGEKAKKIAEGADALDKWFLDKGQLISRLEKEKQVGDVYLVKGSHSMKMEEIAEVLAK